MVPAFVATQVVGAALAVALARFLHHPDLLADDVVVPHNDR